MMCTACSGGSSSSSETELQARLEQYFTDLASGTGPERRIAAEVLIQAGAWSVPTLLPKLESRSLQERRLAVAVLAGIGPPAVAALPRLMGLARDDDRELRGVLAFALLSVPALEPSRLVVALSSPDPRVREMATTALESLGHAPELGRLVRRALAVALVDVDRRVRIEAAAQLSRLGPLPASVVQVLADSLTDEDPHVAFWLATALGGAGSDEAVAMSALRRAAESSDDDLRSAARKALERIRAGR